MTRRGFFSTLLGSAISAGLAAKTNLVAALKPSSSAQSKLLSLASAHYNKKALELLSSKFKFAELSKYENFLSVSDPNNPRKIEFFRYSGTPTPILEDDKDYDEDY